MKACASARFLASFGIEIVEEHLRAAFRDGVADLDSAPLGLGGALLRLLDVARPADDQANLAGGKRVEIFG